VLVIGTDLQIVCLFVHCRCVGSYRVALPGYPTPSSVIIVTAYPKSAGSRIYNEVAGLLTLSAHDLVVAAFLFDQDIRPALGRFLPELIFTNRSVLAMKTGPSRRSQIRSKSAITTAATTSKTPTTAHISTL
jgi:hypothetical protein